MRNILAILLLGTLTLTAFAQKERVYPASIQEKLFQHPGYQIFNVYQPVATLNRAQVDGYMQQLSALGVAPDRSTLDLRSGKWGTLIMTMPMIPGRGLGNTLTWDAVQKHALKDKELFRSQAKNAFLTYLFENANILEIDPAEFGEPLVTVEEGGDYVYIYIPRQIAGVPVRKSFIGASIRYGNLVSMGIHSWGDIATPIQANVSMKDAIELLQLHLGNEHWNSKHLRSRPTLSYLPLASGERMENVTTGVGYNYRLVWEIAPEVTSDWADYVGIVDANIGQLIAFNDESNYFHGNNGAPVDVSGGVYPVSNDQAGEDGVEQDYKMPFVHVQIGEQTYTTNSAGDILLCFEGEISTQLNGAYINITDNCGPILETAITAPLDLGFGANPTDTDCIVAPGASAGNTKAARSSYYEVNKIAEIARNYLTDNVWLTQPLPVTVNINDSCNATGGPAGLRFFTSGTIASQFCNNTGEIAGVFDHEWGHGMDGADGIPGFQSPSEGIADIFASWRLNTSCIGRNFTLNNCGGFGDPCLDCTGVREINWELRSSGAPHDVTWADANCSFVGQSAPCGGSVHCEGQVYAEAFYDMWKRDFPQLYGMDDRTAQELSARLVFLGSNSVNSAFQCNQGSGGCNADSAYLNYLIADDDNGSLEDGTPHMEGIFAAFNRHGIACDNPTVTDSGCASTPVTAPVVSATTFDRSALLTWTAVSNAQSYNVYRGEGVISCSGGKLLLANTTNTEFLDSNIANDMDYTYVVIPLGAGPTCFGPASECVNLDPALPSGNIIMSLDSDVVISDGDGDPFLDNCEQAALVFEATNFGSAAQPGGQILAITADHEDVEILTQLPIDLPNLAENCGSATVTFDFLASNMKPFSSIAFEITYAAPGQDSDRTAIYRIDGVQSDFEFVESLSFGFEDGLDSWSLRSGLFTRATGAGANGSNSFMTSSSFTDNVCDEVHSPIIRLSANSTMSMFTNFDIESFSGSWWDRGNIGIRDVNTDNRTVVSPTGGRTYNASGSVAELCIQGEAGFADSSPTWAESTFTAQDLNTDMLADRSVRLSVIYSTDAAVTGTGLAFDDVTLTNVFIQVADTKNMACVVTCAPFEEPRVVWPESNILAIVNCVSD